MKKLYALTLSICLVIALVACSSTTIPDAKAAFQNADYTSVISLLEGMELEDPEIESMLLISRIHVAFAEKDYQTVVDLTAGMDTLPDDVQQISIISAATLAFASKNYSDVVSLLCEWENRYDYDMYTISISNMIEKAFEDMDATTLVMAYNMDKQQEGAIFKLITDRCDAFDYDYFLFAEVLLEQIPDTMLELNLKQYLSNNAKNKTKAFMKGDWQLTFSDEPDDYAIIRCHVHADDEKCSGVLLHVPEFLVTYHYTENDMYWDGFAFENNYPVTVTNLIRYTNGDYGYTTAAVELNPETSEMYIHVTGVTGPDRRLLKIPAENE